VDILAGLPNRISKVLAVHIADQPAQPALVEAERSWSYQEFGSAVAAAAADLARLQIRPGDRVLLASGKTVGSGAGRSRGGCLTAEAGSDRGLTQRVKRLHRGSGRLLG
jgi:acyl-CoA synthetase (AMP-forming)/AMP-acid ligase II